MDAVTNTTYIFFIYLLMAIFVERTVEIFVSIFNYGELRLRRYKVWNRRAEKYRDKLNRLYNFNNSNPSSSKMFNWLLWKVITEPTYTGGKYIISAQTIKTRYIQIVSKVFANLVALGMVLILFCMFHTSFIDAVLKILPDVPTLLFFKHHAILNIIITSVAVAAGVEPLHSLINKIEKAGKTKSES